MAEHRRRREDLTFGSSCCFCLVLLVLLQSLRPASAITNAPTRLAPEVIKSIRFDQKLNQTISLQLPFIDEKGNTVKLGDYFNKKPVILVLGYYECPMLCGLVHNGLIESLSQIKSTAGEGFSVISVSVDSTEKPILAAAKKAGYVKRYARPGAEEGWHFLTGKQESIQTLCDEVGFHFARDPGSGQIAHPSGIVVVTPRGKVARYFFGVSYVPAQLEIALKDANRNRIGAKVQEFLFLCFHYNPATSPYGKAIILGIRLSGMAVLAGLVGIIWWSSRSKNASAVDLADPPELVPQADSKSGLGRKD